MLFRSQLSSKPDCRVTTISYMNTVNFIAREVRLAKLRDRSLDTPGKRIRAARIAMGLDQKAIAKACGVTVSSVSEWERDKTQDIGGRNAVLASILLDVATRWIVMVSDDPLRYNFASSEEEELVLQYRELGSAQKQMVKTMVEALKAQNPKPTAAQPYPSTKKPPVKYFEGD